MKVAIESYCGVEGCYATVAEIQGFFQSMTKHSMTGIQALNNFLFEPAGLRAWHTLRSMVLHNDPQELKSFSHLADHLKMSACFVQ